MDKVLKALRNDEVKQLLLGENGYAFVYPHFIDILNTDINIVLAELNSHFINDNFNEEIIIKLNIGLAELILTCKDVYYLIRYLNAFLLFKFDSKTKDNFKLRLDIYNLVIKVNSFLCQKKCDENLFEFNLHELIQTEINDQGLNIKLSENGYPIIEFLQI